MRQPAATASIRTGWKGLTGVLLSGVEFVSKTQAIAATARIAPGLDASASKLLPIASKENPESVAADHAFAARVGATQPHRRAMGLAAVFRQEFDGIATRAVAEAVVELFGRAD